jgi:hypothetical protein
MYCIYPLILTIDVPDCVVLIDIIAIPSCVVVVLCPQLLISLPVLICNTPHYRGDGPFMTPFLHFPCRQRPQQNGRVLICVLHSPRGLLFPRACSELGGASRVEPTRAQEAQHYDLGSTSPLLRRCISNTIVLPSRKQSAN